MLDAQPILEIQALRDPLGPQPFPGQSRVALAGLQGGRPGGPAGLDILHLLDVDALRREHRVDDRLPGGGAEEDGLALELLEVVGSLALAEGDAECVAGAHVEHRLQLHAVLQGIREDAGRGEAHVGLPRIDELDRRGAVRRAGLHVGREIAEIAHLLGGPVAVVVEHFERAAWRDPGEGRVGCRQGAADSAQRRGGHQACGRDLEESAPAHAAGRRMLSHRIPLCLMVVPKSRKNPLYRRRLFPLRRVVAQASQLAHFFPMKKNRT